MNEADRGRLAYIVNRALYRRMFFPKYSKHAGGVAFYQLLKDYQQQVASLQAEVKRLTDVDALAQIIRTVDGNHSLGAGALAEAIVNALLSREGEP